MLITLLIHVTLTLGIISKLKYRMQLEETNRDLV
jgi:hypothetical protein